MNVNAIRRCKVLAAAAMLTLGGCMNDANESTTVTSAVPGGTSIESAQSAGAAAAGDATRGDTLFAANCAACHGAGGDAGGVGPSLKNERRRKDMAQTIDWIDDPQPPMPKLYPSPLSERDVADVAAYVQTL